MNEATDIVQEMESVSAGLVPALVLFAAVELGLFEHLTTPRTLTELARLTGCVRPHDTRPAEDGLRRLVVVLQRLGLVQLVDDRVEPTTGSASLFGSGPTAARFRAQAHHRHRQLLPVLAELASAVRTGRPQHAAWRFAGQQPTDTPYQALLRAPDEYARFVAAMDRGSEGVGQAIGKQLDLTGVTELLDLGCGGGIVARELLVACPTLRVHSVDLPAACCYARAETDALPGDVRQRHRISPWDVFGDEPFPGEPCDVVLLSAILGDFPAAERGRLIARAARLVRPGGRLLVSETLLDDDREGPPTAALFSLLMLAVTEGDQLSERELRPLLEAAGFVEIEVFGQGRPGRQLVVARR
jgi:3-hydroxy-5-methyl-1-naphthoate 3-O-methyltransferase